jgi:hypothetical protein
MGISPFGKQEKKTCKNFPISRKLPRKVLNNVTLGLCWMRKILQLAHYTKENVATKINLWKHQEKQNSWMLWKEYNSWTLWKRLNNWMLWKRHKVVLCGRDN